MLLPRLHVLPDQTLAKSTCIGQDNCVSCQLFHKNGGRCDGCTPAHKELLGRNFKWCYRECHECVGFKVKVTAICCRSPLRDMYMTAVTKGAANWNQPSYRFHDRPVLDINERAPFYISSGGVGTMTAGGKSLVEGTPELVAVNLTRVWSQNGFFSRDLKDYLRLPTKTKLVLMVMTLDDILERAWQKELYADPLNFQSVGLDAWMPLSFSAYRQDARMHQYYQLLRTLLVTEKSQAWFTTGDHYRIGVQTDDLILEAAEHIPQMVFNMQFMVNDELFKFHLQLLRHYHQIMPARVRFWLVGSCTSTFVHNVRRMVGERPVYYLSAKPLYMASKGVGLSPNGRSVASKLGKLDLLYQNQRNLNALVSAFDQSAA